MDCDCGVSHPPEGLEHVIELIKTLGPLVRVHTSKGTWEVPRLYIAVHGLSEPRVPTLARRYRWRKIA